VSSKKKKIVRVAGIPNKATKRERAWFTAFKNFWIPRLKKQENYATSYQNAKITEADGQSAQAIQAAAKIAAERDQLRQKEFDDFCKTIDQHFSGEESPELLVLKFAKLLQTNPEIVDQIEKVNSLIQSLSLNYSTNIKFTNIKNRMLEAEDEKE